MMRTNENYYRFNATPLHDLGDLGLAGHQQSREWRGLRGQEISATPRDLPMILGRDGGRADPQ
jgi:hypothetical protein